MAGIKAVFTGFNYLDESVASDIRKNINCLFSTIEGTCPGDRAFGLSREYIDAPRPVAENLIAIDIDEKIKIYEPRCIVENIEFTSDKDGQLVARAYVGIKFETNK